MGELPHDMGHNLKRDDSDETDDDNRELEYMDLKEV
jgi:hypothetical protein